VDTKKKNELKECKEGGTKKKDPRSWGDKQKNEKNVEWKEEEIREALSKIMHSKILLSGEIKYPYKTFLRPF
jgi:hypothetical protein